VLFLNIIDFIIHKILTVKTQYLLYFKMKNKKARKIVGKNTFSQTFSSHFFLLKLKAIFIRKYFAFIL
jgi:hypothetical protein